jgi:hypothetical protein
MNSTMKFIFVGAVIACMTAPAVYADGEACSASETKVSDEMLRKAEEAEKAGRIQDAYKAATRSIPSIHCAGNGYKRRDGMIERTSKKLGAEAEKAGRFGEAYEYYRAPERHGRADYDLANADRAMLKYAKAKPDDYKVVSEAANYFARREISSSLNEVRAIARRGGDKMLAKEEKTFAAHKDSLDDLRKAREWLDLAGAAKGANARAEQRGDTLLAEGSFRSVEQAFSYYNFAENPKKLNAAKDRAHKLGDDAARKGDHGLAAKFYDLSGDEAKAAAVAKQKEKTETKRQDKFKQDQKSLEKELGF